jgi:hypothetical protein
VEALLVERDEFVSAGQPVIRLSSPLGREVEVRVPAHLLSHVRVGQELPVWSVQDRNRDAETGTVIEIAQGSSIRGELHPVLVSLPPQSLGSGAGLCHDRALAGCGEKRLGHQRIPGGRRHCAASAG